MNFVGFWPVKTFSSPERAAKTALGTPDKNIHPRYFGDDYRRKLFARFLIQ